MTRWYRGVRLSLRRQDSICVLGRRVSTTTLEGTTRHVYDNNWQVIADIDEQGNVISSYTWGAGIDNLLAAHVNGVAYYPLTDVQGTVWGYVDSQNTIVARFEYDAWGNILSATSSVPALATNRYRFQGREWSAATGLINFRARWYDPVTGRWLSKDPIGLNGGLNLYAFCGNDPICNIDSYGTDTYVPDSCKHGGPHVDRYNKGGQNIGRYTPEGDPIPHKGKFPPKIPKSDIPKFLSAASKLSSLITLIMTTTAMGDSEIHPGMNEPGPGWSPPSLPATPTNGPVPILWLR